MMSPPRFSVLSNLRKIEWPERGSGGGVRLTVHLAAAAEYEWGIMNTLLIPEHKFLQVEHPPQSTPRVM